MSWARLDDGLTDNPKILAASLAARWAFIASLCYAGRRRDPHITAAALHRVDANRRIATELESVGLWDADGDGWIIHDWAAYQAPLSDAERQRRNRRKRDGYDT